MAPENPKTTSNPRITRVYTRVGDAGESYLVGNRKVSKAHPRLEAYGTVDELQSWMGYARDKLAAVVATHPALTERKRLELLDRHLAYFQNQIFTVNSDLATRLEDRWDGMPQIGEDDIVYMEQVIDGYNKDLPELQDFVLPGGHEAVTTLHLCRVVCRRAERAVARLIEHEAICPSSQPFLNRLSDGFFVWSRTVDAALRLDGLVSGEVIWQHAQDRPPLP